MLIYCSCQYIYCVNAIFKKSNPKLCEIYIGMYRDISHQIIQKGSYFLYFCTYPYTFKISKWIFLQRKLWKETTFYLQKKRRSLDLLTVFFHIRRRILTLNIRKKHLNLQYSYIQNIILYDI